jgi:phosphoenolpyruvate---glycerone phosphotransferase subunit DhaL
VTAARTIDRDLVVAWLRGCVAEIAVGADHLTQLDAAIGDGDHGTNMKRGFGTLTDLLDGDELPEAPGQVLARAGRILVSKVGGASGPLWGTFLRATGKAMGDADRVSVEEFAAALAAGLGGVIELGAARPGDKTMVDALDPAVERLGEGPFEDLAVLFRAAAEAARLGAHDTIQLQARKGRASYLGERSIGHEDPGAASAVIVMGALAGAVE